MRLSTYPKITEACVTVSNYQDGNLSGWLIHPRLEAPLRVRSLPELLLTLNALLRQGAPPVDCRGKKSDSKVPADILATLRLQILFREHYTWQGSILWEEQGVRLAFHSVLELIQILDELLAE